MSDLIKANPPTHKRFKNHVGLRYGQLTVIEYAGYRQHKRDKNHYWLCRCECGNLKTVAIQHLVSNKTTSCGCRNRSLARKRATTHGMSKTEVYQIWKGIIKRCTNTNDSKYPSYGGRGINVCAEWLTDFTAFFDHVGHRPSPNHSIDRINNSRGYEPGNVRWATPAQQANNTRNNTILTFQNRSITLSEWAKITNISYRALLGRLQRGWSIERTLTTPCRNHK